MKFPHNFEHKIIKLVGIRGEGGKGALFYNIKKIVAGIYSKFFEKNSTVKKIDRYMDFVEIKTGSIRLRWR